MPKAKKLSALDEMRVISWCKETLAAAGCKDAREFEKISLDADGTEREFRLYEKGGRVPSADTLARVDQRFDLPISQVFLVGPDGCPLWEVLRGKPDACRQALDLWLRTETDSRFGIDLVSRSFTSLNDKLTLACKVLGIDGIEALADGPVYTYHYYAPTTLDSPEWKSPDPHPANPPEPTPAFSVDGYAPAFLTANEMPSLPAVEERAAFVEMAIRDQGIACIRNHPGPFPLLANPIGPDALVGIFALRTLALERGEMLRETHYLLSIVRQAIEPAVDLWGISTQLYAFTAD